MFYRSHPRVYHNAGGDLVTRQEFKDECDINNILNQFKLTGIINHINKQSPTYEDLPDPTTYQDSMNTIIQAENAFNSLPSVVRDYFNGDPSAFLDAMSQPGMEPKLREWGLLPPEQPAPQAPQPEVSPVPSTPP